MDSSHARACAAVIALSLWVWPVAHAQSPAATRATSEETEPRTIGTIGTTTVGVSGFLDRFFSSEERLPTNYTAQVDVGRFLTRRIVLVGGLSGSGSVGGEDPEDLPLGSGAASLHAFGGLAYYFSPQSIVSLYSGGEYWAQLTQRGDRDAGSVLGKLGVQGAISSRASVFVEGGYGVGLTKGDDDETLTRVVARVGVRFKF